MKHNTVSAGARKQNTRYALRFIVVVVVACLVDSAVVLLLKKPLPWAAIIPATIPIWVVAFVILPMQRNLKARR